MNKSERLELGKWAVTFAKKSGANDVAVNITNDRSIEISYRDESLEKLQESTQNGLSLDVYADSKYSSHSTNDLRKDSLEKFISEAIAMTKYLGADKFRGLPDPKYYEGRKDINLDQVDHNHSSITSKQRVDMAAELQKLTSSKSDKIVTCTAGCGDGITESVKVQSNGFEGTNARTYFYLGAEVSLDDGKGGRPEGWRYRSTRHFDELPPAEELATPCVEVALSRLGQTKLESGRYDLIIENIAGNRPLGAMRGAMSGGALYQERSYLEGKLDQPIASDKLTIIDDPFIVRGRGSRLYDGEGMATRKRTILEAGVLKQYFISAYYSRKLEVEPTTAGTSNVIFGTGDRDMEAMIASMERGILVTRFIGGNANSTTGDFSYGIMGMLIENGKRVKPVNEMNISGNLIDFWMSLSEVGNDPHIYSSTRTPSMYFKDVEFSGL